MNELKIILDRENLEPGEAVIGVAQWRLDSQPRSVEVRLFWFTRGKGTEDVGVVDTIGFDAPGVDERRPFKFKLPESPYTFSGKLISLVWALELVVQPGGESTRLHIAVAPLGREIVLTEIPAAK